MPPSFFLLCDYDQPLSQVCLTNLSPRATRWSTLPPRLAKAVAWPWPLLLFPRGRPARPAGQWRAGLRGPRGPPALSSLYDAGAAWDMVPSSSQSIAVSPWRRVFYNVVCFLPSSLCIWRRDAPYAKHRSEGVLHRLTHLIPIRIQ